jgi:hypothetical protein
MLMPTLTEQWSLQKFGETLISSIRFGLFVMNKLIHVADVWVIRIHEMEGKNLSILFENKTVNENYSSFLSILNEACDKHIPTKAVVIRPDDKTLSGILKIKV